MFKVKLRKQIMMLPYQKSRKKYFCTSDCNKFTSNIIGAKIKQKKVVNESNISDLV